MTHYLFHEAGSIPGIPGTFAHCRVDVDSDGALTATPLPLAPHIPPDVSLFPPAQPQDETPEQVDVQAAVPDTLPEPEPEPTSQPDDEQQPAPVEQAEA